MNSKLYFTAVLIFLLGGVYAQQTADVVRATLNGLQFVFDKQSGSILSMSHPATGTMLQTTADSAGIVDLAFPVKEFEPLRLASRYSKNTQIIKTQGKVTVHWEELGASRSSVPFEGKISATVIFEEEGDGKSISMSCKVENHSAVKNWVHKVENEVGVPGIIVANAAIVTLASLNEITSEQWSRELRVNLDGAFHLTKCATARLIHHGRSGRVVFIGSWAAHSVHIHIPAYCVSKAALRMLCKCMALELAPHNILVNEIAPGYVDAGLSGRIFEKDPAMKKEALQKVPIKKLISAAEVAQQVVQLCHPLNEHMTGSTVLMDGGLSLLT